MQVQLDGQPEPSEAHCINPGRMEAFVDVGARVWVSEATAAGRKLQCPRERSALLNRGCFFGR